MALDNGLSIDSIYLDFMKAFDTVPHKRLIYKLRMNGLSPSMLRWIAGFLTGRNQQVCVNGSMSKWADVTSGIPQGSVMGPILFVIYINGLPNEIKSDIYMFADDTKVFRTIKTNDDQCVLQDDLDELTAWSTKWLLTFHPDKCKIMHIGKPLPWKISLNTLYTMVQLYMNWGIRMKRKILESLQIQTWNLISMYILK